MSKGLSEGSNSNKHTDLIYINLIYTEMPFKSDEKSGKVGRTFPDFYF